ncbi:MAG TPA: pantoate--beta-alanine ligase [Allosphingosinicella sp.]|nr:pantoate--beta-alanine ligase [Allosphingosinicella sp.]
MQIIRDADALRREIDALKADGGSIAFVPTMGALHDGHLALVAEARLRADHVVASIFVNPTQFGANEDLSVYPRREAADAALLDAAGVAILWAPDVETMYPDGPAATIRAGAAAQGLDGDSRPGHFDGVATIVARLFDQVRPDVALFGEKDYQQLAVIRELVRGRSIPVEIVGVPTQRDADGLALSSRNAYLSEEERTAARTLPRALGEAAAAIEAGGDVAEALEKARARLEGAGFDPIDYVALHDAETLAPMNVLDRPARLLAAARMGRTRLIDNLPVNPA